MAKNTGIREKREAIKAAEELVYGSAVINKIKAAKDANEVRRILATARRQGA